MKPEMVCRESMCANMERCQFPHACREVPSEPIDRGPLPEVSDSDLAEFDRLRDLDKGPTLARRDAEHAMDLQIQMQGYIGGLE